MQPVLDKVRIRAAVVAMSLCLTAVAQAQTAGASRSGGQTEGERAMSPLASAQPVTKANWLGPAHIRWAMLNARLLMPTAGVRHASHVSSLPVGRPVSLDDLKLELPQGRSATFAQYLDGNRVDAMLVLHKGRVVFEQYYGGMQPHDAHGWASMSKSLIGLLAVQLMEEGRIDASQPISRYVPELATTPLGSATVQQCLDMEVALSYPPQLPPDIGLFTAAGLLPSREGVPTSIREFLLKAPQSADHPHGSVFYYQNGATEAVAWALVNVTGRSIAQLATERVWQPMGAEDDAYFTVDSRGSEFTAGGLASTLRDAARFGELVRNQGKVGGQQVVSKAAVARVFQQPSAQNVERLARSGRSDTGYANFWWHQASSNGALYALGRFGQRIFVDQANELTLVQFGSYADTRARAVSGDQAVAAHENELRSNEGLVALANAVASRLTQTSGQAR